MSGLIQCSSDSCDMAYRVILAGATGETGRLVLDNLLKDDRISKVPNIQRRNNDYSWLTDNKLAFIILIT